ncbi:MAG: hypothetical protein IKD10_06800 [Lentisphaeria bacterium]|nr:hypothetical protein [Lentisphaerota bacterium]MBR7144635.1 hypothetical protein [Lentisphaeria bacterium]
MNSGKNFLTGIILTAIMSAIVLPLEAATTNTCVSSCKPRVRSCQSTCTPQRAVRSRVSKLRQKHNEELALLKEIHEMQKLFLTKNNGKNSGVTKNDRDLLKKKIEALPSYIRKSDDLFFDRMENLDNIIRDIISGKEKYKNKKKITNPVKLLEEIQRKQRSYLMKKQIKHQKKLSK